MKKLIYIFSVLILVSCNNNMKESAPAVNVDYETLEEAEEFIIKPSSFIYEELATQKLQEMYDLINLKDKHPEFAKTIKSQLKDYTNDKISTPNSTNILIENLKLKGELIKVSDSVQKMKLYYDMVSNNSKQKDSLWAIITVHEINFEGKKIKSKKIKFVSL